MIYVLMMQCMGYMHHILQTWGLEHKSHALHHQNKPSIGTVGHWYCGPLVWAIITMGQWSISTEGHRYYGIVGLRYYGPVVHRYCGPLVLWAIGTMGQLSIATVAIWYCGPSVLWASGPSLL